MKAILLATNAAEDAGTDLSPAALRPVLDRPLLQHAVEVLARRGVRHIDVITGAEPERAQNLLGDGRRWGCDIRYHLARRDDQPVRAIQRAFGDADYAIVARADHFIDFDAHAADATTGTTAFVSAQDGHLHWAGWAIVSSRQVHALPESVSLSELGARLIDLIDRGGRLRAVSGVLRVGTLSGWLSAQRAALAGEMPVLLANGQETLKGVRIGRGARVHASVTFTPPVLVAAEARIEAGVHLGPNAVIGESAFVDRDCVVENATVLPGTYIGEGLDLRDAVASPSAIASARHATHIEVPDTLLLGAVAVGDMRAAVARGMVRAAAAVLWLASAPLWLPARAFRRRPQEVPPAATLKDLCWRVLPGLADVATGRLALTGDTTPGARASVAGLIAAAQVVCAADATADDRWSANAVHRATAGPWDDLWMLARYAGRAVRSAMPGTHHDPTFTALPLR